VRTGVRATGLSGGGSEGAIRDGGSASSIVFRAVTPDQAQAIRAGEGIIRPKPFHGTTPTQHVAGTPHARDPWMSATRSFDSAVFFSTYGGTMPANLIVEIDLSKLDPSRIFDVSTPSNAARHLKTPFTRFAAAKHQEVLIYGEIPADAITRVHERF
jgi:hypothetical protein